jgi:hypothetical protein
MSTLFKGPGPDAGCRSLGGGAEEPTLSETIARLTKRPKVYLKYRECRWEY